jgi:hypothetical protein
MMPPLDQRFPPTAAVLLLEAASRGGTTNDGVCVRGSDHSRHCGIGIFTPTILAVALGANSDHARSVADVIANDIVAVQGAALITTLLILGVAFAV